VTGYCGHCHRDTTWYAGSGTAWTLWLCCRCQHMMGTRIHDVGTPDIAALDMGDIE
jgi:hypothetical protein